VLSLHFFLPSFSILFRSRCSDRTLKSPLGRTMEDERVMLRVLARKAVLEFPSQGGLGARMFTSGHLPLHCAGSAVSIGRSPWCLPCAETEATSNALLSDSMHGCTYRIVTYLGAFAEEN
jgi:hypothetical protein